jgi:cytochrome b561
MPLLNSPTGYGTLTKLLHWAIAALFLLQYASAAVMLRTPPEGAVLGLSQATQYNWHKSLGLLALVLAVARIANRRAGTLPPWAPTITPIEQMIIYRAEQLLYAAMLVMPLSGFCFVMAGGYGVRLFGAVDLPNPIGYWPLLGMLAKWVHVTSAYLVLLPLGAHLGIVLAHQLGLRDRLLRRMLP